MNQLHTLNRCKQLITVIYEDPSDFHLGEPCHQSLLISHFCQVALQLPQALTYLQMQSFKVHFIVQ